MEDKSFDSGTSDCFGYIHLRFFVFLGIICAKWHEGYSVILQSGIEILETSSMRMIIFSLSNRINRELKCI